MSGSANGDTFSFSYSEFTPVKSRKKRKNKSQKERPSPSASLQRIRDELVKDEWFTQCQQKLQDALSLLAFESPEVLCLGLGSPTSSKNACAQLAFLIEICDFLQVERSKVSLYDPVFTADDRSLFAELQISVLTENRSAGYPLDVRTICFMPHCDMELYEALLRTNWAPERLSNLFLVSNRLEDYVDSNPKHKLETGVPCLLRLAPVLDCQQLPASKQWPTAFNNTSLQFLRSQELVQPEWFSESSKSPETPSEASK